MQCLHLAKTTFGQTNPNLAGHFRDRIWPNGIWPELVFLVFWPCVCSFQDFVCSRLCVCCVFQDFCLQDVWWASFWSLSVGPSPRTAPASFVEFLRPAPPFLFRRIHCSNLPVTSNPKQMSLATPNRCHRIHSTAGERTFHTSSGKPISSCTNLLTTMHLRRQASEHKLPCNIAERSVTFISRRGVNNKTRHDLLLGLWDAAQ